MIDCKTVADAANMIINGYAFTKDSENIKVLNLNNPDKAVVLDSEGGSAKFFVKENGDTVLQNRGRLNDRELLKIEKFIKKNYQEMYMKWSEYSKNGFYQN